MTRLRSKKDNDDDDDEDDDHFKTTLDQFIKRRIQSKRERQFNDDKDDDDDDDEVIPCIVWDKKRREHFPVVHTFIMNLSASPFSKYGIVCLFSECIWFEIHPRSRIDRCVHGKIQVNLF